MSKSRTAMKECNDYWSKKRCRRIRKEGETSKGNRKEGTMKKEWQQLKLNLGYFENRLDHYEREGKRKP